MKEWHVDRPGILCVAYPTRKDDNLVEPIRFDQDPSGETVPGDPNRLKGTLWQVRFYTARQLELARRSGRRVELISKHEIRTWTKTLRKYERFRRLVQRDVSRKRGSLNGKPLADPSTWGRGERLLIGQRYDPHGRHRILARVEVL